MYKMTLLMCRIWINACDYVDSHLNLFSVSFWFGSWWQQWKLLESEEKMDDIKYAYKFIM